MKKIVLFVLAFIFCAAGCAEPETVGPVELMEFIGRPYAELMEFIGEPRDEYEAFQQGIQYYKSEDGYTVYLKDMEFAVRGTVDSYPDYGWEADTTLEISLGAGMKDQYMLVGCCIGELFPDVQERLLADGWVLLQEQNMYTNFRYEKVIEDVKYTLELIRDVARGEESYDHIICVDLKGCRVIGGN